MMKSLWGGRFTQEADSFFKEFNRSLPFDYLLWDADIEASKAYASGLEKSEVLTTTEYTQMIAGLESLEAECRENPHYMHEAIEAGYEDIHALVEARLSEKVGDLAKKLHTGRSRNDQVATDLRLYMRQGIDDVLTELQALSKALVAVASDNRHVILPGYTHLQRAQPVLFGHYLLSFYEMFRRDRQRLSEMLKRVNTLPLGSGALAGHNHGIDRQHMADILGFESLTANSIDATSDRDFVVEFVQAASLIMVHLSRLAEDLILYSSLEFGFVKMSDQVATGSSLMPQKKNPDALELIRGKAGRVFGHEMQLLAMLKGLPSCYNKDMQEDKEALFDSLHQVKSCLKVMSTVITTMEIQAQQMAQATQTGFLNATDLADYLVGRGIAFRKAHELVGEIVLYADGRGKRLEELSLDEYQRFSGAISSDVFASLDIKQVIDAKGSFGGTATEQVEQALAAACLELQM